MHLLGSPSLTGPGTQEETLPSSGEMQNTRPREIAQRALVSVLPLINCHLDLVTSPLCASVSWSVKRHETPWLPYGGACQNKLS